jgi:tubulin-folding cofactor B
MADITIAVSSPLTRSERRFSPSLSISALKDKLELITGVPPACQTLVLLTSSGSKIPLSSDATFFSEGSTSWTSAVAAPADLYHAELQVLDSRPASVATELADVSKVDKYVMPASQYAGLADSVLAYKRSNQLGRFDPGYEAQRAAHADRLAAHAATVTERGIALKRRCRVDGSNLKRGAVAFVGEVEDIVALSGEDKGAGVWVGVRLDEPVGKNDGRVRPDGIRYFDAEGDKHGMFVRPERVEVGAFEALGVGEGLEDDDDDLEEL